MNVREAETEVKKSKTNKKAPKEKARKDPYMSDLENEFMRILGTKVKFVKGSNISKIEIEFYNEEDLSRIYEIITK